MQSVKHAQNLRDCSKYFERTTVEYWNSIWTLPVKELVFTEDQKGNC